MRRLAAAVALALLIFAAPAAAVPPRASLTDIEDEVMCVECGTSLQVSQSPVAMQERDFIRERIAAGDDKAQIKAALVDQYGKAVLAEPDARGFDAAVWIVPAAMVLLALGGIVVAARRWRRNGAEPAAAAPPPLDPEDARRLDAELLR
jgi:cytochrome c-type biogenesis protein CcmH